MTDERLRTVSRVRHLKESFQQQAEIRLANSLTQLRQVEASVAYVQELRMQLQSHPTTGLTVAELQNRALYSDVLATQLNRRQQELDVAQSDVDQQRHEVHSAYVDTNRWTTLEEIHANRVRQELNRQAQTEADDLAVQRYASHREGQ